MYSDAELAEFNAEAARSAAECGHLITGGENGPTPVVACECCGTDVMLVPEGRTADGPGREYRPAIWETESWVKHTGRRCNWQRARKLRAFPDRAGKPGPEL